MSSDLVFTESNIVIDPRSRNKLFYDPVMSILGINSQNINVDSKAYMQNNFLHHIVQQPRCGNHLNAQLQTNGSGSCGVYRQWNIMKELKNLEPNHAICGSIDETGKYPAE